MNFLIRYLKQRYKLCLSFLLFCLIFIVMFVLYHLPMTAVFYPVFLCLLLGIFFLGQDCYSSYKKHMRLTELQHFQAEEMPDLPVPRTIDDTDYQELIRLLREERVAVANQMNTRYMDMMDYYTAWAHQIKTPIASIRLNLQNEDSEFSRLVAEDLQRIEQYVEMVLAFLRLDSESTDYVFKEQDLDAILKTVIKKYSTQFIHRKIRLDYEPLNTTVITDEKWLSFVVEQILLNSLKYTPSGSIKISCEKPHTLCIRDTGIGISAEDLPRIFEKGYTGYNGRKDKKASGIGLYLCRRICDNLGHTITAESVPDEGTVIRIGLEQSGERVE